MQDRWSRETTRDEGHSLFKWGEGEEQTRTAGDIVYIRKYRWQEKLERANGDYWEKRYEEQTSHISRVSREVHSERVIMSGKKEFQNNRGYYATEEWSETAGGKVNVKRQKDDGLGTKSTENFEA
jgi:hypothetical protein